MCVYVCAYRVLICIGEDISVLLFMFGIIFRLCLFWFCLLYIWNSSLISFLLSCILLLLRALCRYAVVIFPNLMCWYLGHMFRHIDMHVYKLYLQFCYICIYLIFFVTFILVQILVCVFLFVFFLSCMFGGKPFGESTRR